MDKKLKVFSLERTFSNFLIRTLQDNFEEYRVDDQIKSPWKHQIPHLSIDNYLENPQDKVLTNALKNPQVEVHYFLPVKHPYKWVISYFRGWKKGALRKNHYIQHANDGILVQYLDHMPPEPDDEVFLRAMVDKYNQWMMHSLALTQSYEYAEIFDYECMLHVPTRTLDYIEDKYDLTKKNDEWIIEGKEVAPDQSVTNRSYDDSYWIEGQYMDDLLDIQKEIIDDNVFWELVKQCGMEINK